MKKYLLLGLIVAVAVVVRVRGGGDDLPKPDLLKPELESTSPANTNTVIATMPLYWDHRYGEYRVQVFFGGNEGGGSSTTAVIDTGSPYLVVAESQCEGCDSSQGLYVALGGSGVDTTDSTTLGYGGETDTVEWYTDSVTLYGLDDAFSQVEFAAVTQTASMGDNFNIFGLAVSDSHEMKSPLLDQLMFFKQVILPYFYLDISSSSNSDMSTPSASQLVLGALPLGGVPLGTVPFLDVALAKQNLSNGSSFKYYMIKCLSISVDDVKVDNIPEYIMVDSGNTDLSFGSDAFNSLSAVMTPSSQLTIQLENMAITYDLSEPGWDKTLYETVEHWDAIDKGTPWDGKLFILGNQFMKGHIFAFNLDENTLTIY